MLQEHARSRITVFLSAIVIMLASIVPLRSAEGSSVKSSDQKKHRYDERLLDAHLQTQNSKALPKDVIKNLIAKMAAPSPQYDYSFAYPIDFITRATIVPSRWCQAKVILSAFYQSDFVLFPLF
jgi:hypothetical protein